LAEGASLIHVITACARHHGAQFRARHRATQRQQTCSDPQEQHHERRISPVRGFGRPNEDADAECRADHDAHRRQRADDARRRCGDALSVRG
jgi:hypothetical protein